MMSTEQMSAALIALQQTVASLEARLEGAVKLLDEHQRLTETIYNNSAAFKSMGERFTHVFGCIDTLRSDFDKQQQVIDELRMKPGKRWESVAGTILIALATAAAGYVFARVMNN